MNQDQAMLTGFKKINAVFFQYRCQNCRTLLIRLAAVPRHFTPIFAAEAELNSDYSNRIYSTVLLLLFNWRLLLSTNEIIWNRWT